MNAILQKKLPLCLLLFLATLFTCQPSLNAQNLPVLSGNFQSVPLREVFRQWEQKYPVSFSYDDALLATVTVTAQIREVPLDEALQQILRHTDLAFEIIDNQYILILQNPGRNETYTPPPPDHTLCGTIVDNESGEKLTGATAYVKNTPHGITTNEQGYFLLKGPFRPADTLMISYLGYNPLSLPVGSLLNRPCQDFRLGFSTQWIPELVVREFAMDMIGVGEQGTITFDKERIPTLPGWGEPDVMRMLQLLPGIGSSDESAAGLNVRGGTPDQNLLLWEGIPVYHTGHFFGLYDAFNPYIVDQVNVFRGNFGVAFGGRSSSVIDVRGKPDYVTEKTWGVGFNLLSLQAFVEKPLFQKERIKRKKPDKKGALLIAGRKSWVDLINSRTYENLFDQVFQNGRIAVQQQYRDQSEYVSWDPTINYGDLNVKFRWSAKKNRDNIFTLFSTTDQLDYRFSFDDSLQVLRTSDIIKATNLGWSWQQHAQWSPNFRIHYKVAGSAYENKYDFSLTENRDLPEERHYLTRNIMGDFSAQLHHTWDVTPQHRMSFGYQLSSQAAEFVFRDTNLVTEKANLLDSDTITNTLHTFYASFDYDVSDHFSFSLGIRENQSPARGLYYSEPRISFVWRTLWDGFSINGSMGRYWQFVFHIVNFSDLGVGEPLWALSSAEIPAQEQWQWTLGLRFEKPSFLLDAEIYRKDGRNLTSLNLRVDSDFERPLSFNGRSSASGLDVLLRKRIPPYSFWASWSAAEVNYQFPELNNNQPFPARHDIRQRINLVNMVSLHRWDFAANLHLRTGSPYTIPDVVQIPCTDCTEPQYALNYGTLNTNRLPGVARLDISATWKFGKNGTKGKAGLAIYNLLDRRNILDVDHILDSSTGSAPVPKPLNRLAAGRSPNLFVQYEW